MNISDKLRELMIEQDMTQKELADKTKINHAAIQRYVSGGTNNIPITRLQLMAKALGTTAEYLLGWQVPSGLNRVEETHLIPVIGRVACGYPIIAEQNIDRMMSVPVQLKCNFILEAHGDSMTDAGIYDGDLVYIRQQPDVEDGEIGVVIIGEEATLKRVYHNGNVLQLVSCNAKYKPLIVDGSDGTVRIAGKAIAYTHII